MRGDHSMRTFAVLASAVGVIVTTLVLASAASATRLCSINIAPCPNVNSYIGGSFLTGDLKFGTTVKLETWGGTMNPTITCTRSSYSLITLNRGDGIAAWVSFTLHSLMLMNCTSVGPTGCNTSSVQLNLPTFGYVYSDLPGDGILKVYAPTISFACNYFGSPLTCQLASNMLTATVLGGLSADVRFVFQTVSAPGNLSSICPQFGAFTATYSTTEPLFVTAS
jgi:hypothetical protein